MNPRSTLLVLAVLVASCGPKPQPPRVELAVDSSGEGKAVDEKKPAPAKKSSAYEERIAAFRTAVEKGRISEVKDLLKTADINDKDDDGQTPLMWAAAKGNRAMVWLLFAAGGLPGERDNQGRNVLMHAIEGGHVEIAKILLSPTSAMNASGDLLKTLGLGAKLNLPSVGIDDRDKGGRTPLMLAARAGSVEMIELLLSYLYRADVTPRDAGGKTALMYAAQGGNQVIVEKLLEPLTEVKSGLAYVAHKDDAGKTASMLAVAGGHPKVAAFLDEFAKDPEAKDEKGQTPLMVAIRKGDRAAIERLTRRGVSLVTPDAEGVTPALLAAEMGDGRTVFVLSGSLAGYGFSYQKLQRVLNVPDKQGRTALIAAAVADHANVIEALIGKGDHTVGRGSQFTDMVVTMNLTTDKEGRNALLHAAALGKDAAVAALLNSYGDTKDYDLPGPENRKELLARTDKAGKTALKLAEEGKHTQVVELLKKYGAK